jgi:uncharacterized membrane protein YbhN (UPF0104 family)
MKRALRLLGTFAITGLALAYILSKIDVGKTADTIRTAQLGWTALAAALFLVTLLPMAWRWRLLLRARGIDEDYWWLLRAYFVSYAVGQVLPTSVGGDASRIFETARRHPGQTTPITGSVLLERALGGAVTLVLAGAGFLLAIGRYAIGAYLWIELLFVLLTAIAGFTFFSRWMRRQLAFALPLARRLKLEAPARAVYDGIHGYRAYPGTLAIVCAVTALVQIGRIFSIYAAGKAVGVHLSPLPYFVLGPLLFLVMLVPFTINGLAVREAFFVSFLGQLGVDRSLAFDTGFLFFLVTIALSLPGVAILAREGSRRAR